MTKANKIIVAIALLIAVVSISVCSYAFNPTEIQVPEDINGEDDIKTFGGQLLGIFQVVGTVLAVVILLILGIKYMMGSAEEKADYKKSMIPYLVGAVLIFGATWVASIVYQLASGLTGNTEGT